MNQPSLPQTSCDHPRPRETVPGSGCRVPAAAGLELSAECALPHGASVCFLDTAFFPLGVSFLMASSPLPERRNESQGRAGRVKGAGLGFRGWLTSASLCFMLGDR